jgi:phage baseplate assembly protein gpV
VLTRVRHELDPVRGYLAELSSEPPEPRAVSPEPQLRATLGKVRSVSDPDGHGRVQVSLSVLHDIESSWMPVLSPGAGAGKGLVALPDVDDLVLVLLLGGDPAQGVVLGGLYGGEGPQDSGVVGDAVRRFILGTPGGRMLTLDDDQGTLTLVDGSGGTVELADRRIRVEDATGNRLELTGEVVRLHAAVSLELDAPGQAIRIRGSSVDFETA